MVGTFLEQAIPSAHMAAAQRCASLAEREQKKKDDKTPDLEPQERSRRAAQIEPVGERLGKQTRFSRDELETGLRSRSLDSRQPSGPVALYALVRCECAKI